MNIWWTFVSNSWRSITFWSKQSNGRSWVYLLSCRKNFQKTNEDNQDQREKQIEASKVLKPNERKSAIKDAILEGELNEVAKNKIEKSKKG